MINAIKQAAPERSRAMGPSVGTAGKTALVTVAIWLAVCILYVMLITQAEKASTQPSTLQRNLQIIIFSYLPLMLASVGLAFAFARKPDWMLSPIGMLLVGLLLLLVLLPLMEACSVIAMLWTKDLPLSGFFVKLQKRGLFIWWIHGCIIALAYVAQAAYASLRRTEAQEQAWQQEQTEKLALRLRLLQGQLKPHFLFNALNSISALVRTADRSLACHALAQLRDLLRYAVHASKQDWLTVADELGFIRDYLDLQMLRYGERLKLEWHIDDLAWERLACAPLLLQPLVENAIHHGVENHHERCCIRIRLTMQHGSVCLVVENPLIDAKRVKKRIRGMASACRPPPSVCSCYTKTRRNCRPKPSNRKSW